MNPIALIFTSIGIAALAICVIITFAEPDTEAPSTSTVEETSTTGITTGGRLGLRLGESNLCVDFTTGQTTMCF